MTRKEAINILNALKFILNNDQYTDEIEEALDIAIESLQQPDHIADDDKKDDHLREVTKKVDVISRQVVKDALVERTILEWEQLKTCYPMLEVVDEVPPAQPEQRWIPVTERLPENEDVLIQFPSNMAVGRYCGEWRINSGGNWETEICVDDEKPIAWMPLPEPYRKEGEKDE